MNKEEIITKWLNHQDLTDDEKEYFNNLDHKDSYLQLSEKAKQFKALSYQPNDHWAQLRSKMMQQTTQKKSKSFPFRILLKIAAVFVLAIGSYFAFFNIDKDTFKSSDSNQISTTLPDESFVKLNTFSSISYDEKNWDSTRKVDLKGEAHFKVTKGKTFEVHTNLGMVQVVGTQFNVKQRTDYFEVSCFEGKVKVHYNNKFYDLVSGNTFEVDQNKVILAKNKNNKPDWFDQKSTFDKVPISKVIKELEWQYGVKVFSKNIDTSKLFTGNFVHSDIKIALKSITIPMRLEFSIENNRITLKSSD